MPISADRNADVPRFVGVRPRQRCTVTDADGRHELDPAIHRVSISHPWVAQRPELWEVVGRVYGQDRASYERAASRTRVELSAACGRAAAEFERAGTTRTVVDPDQEDRALGWGGARGVRPGRRRPLRLPLRLP